MAAALSGGRLVLQETRRYSAETLPQTRFRKIVSAIRTESCAGLQAAWAGDLAGAGGGVTAAAQAGRRGGGLRAVRIAAGEHDPVAGLRFGCWLELSSPDPSPPAIRPVAARASAVVFERLVDNTTVQPLRPTGQLPIGFAAVVAGAVC